MNQFSQQTPEESNQIKINRPIYVQEHFEEIAEFTKLHFSILEVFTRMCCCTFTALITSLIPVLKWMPHYKWKDHFSQDVLSGLTVGVLTIPQSMAYAMLARSPPAVGLYMAVFPVLTYFIFSTSKHNSIGTFSVISLMMGEIVDHIKEHEGTTYSSMQIVATASFLVAAIQLGMFFLRFGLIANLLSDPLINGFFCGAGLHVIASMLPSIFGLKARKGVSLFTIPHVVYYTIINLNESNRHVVTMSIMSIFAMVVSNELIKPWIFKRFKLILPFELIIVLMATAVSYSYDLPTKFNMQLLEHVPAGLPAPKVPVFVIIPQILIRCALIAIVSYSATISMAMIIAQEGNYEVKPNQEMLAMSMANLAGSFFSCMPISSSLARTWVQYKTGGKSQISNVVSASFMIMILMYIYPLFNFLPMCVLSSVVMVALKGMLGLARQMPGYFEQNFWDGIVWLCAFVPTVVFSDMMGLFVGIVMSAISIFIRANNPYTCVLGRVPGTEIYVDSKRYKGVESLYGIRIFHYSGTLNYAMRLYIKGLIYDAAMLKPNQEIRSFINPYRDPIEHLDLELGSKHLRILILDFTALRYIDPACVELLHLLTIEFEEINVSVYLAGCSGLVLDRIKLCEKRRKRKHTFIMFPTVHDAATYAEIKIEEMDSQDRLANTLLRLQ